MATTGATLGVANTMDGVPMSYYDVGEAVIGGTTLDIVQMLVLGLMEEVCAKANVISELTPALGCATVAAMMGAMKHAEVPMSDALSGIREALSGTVIRRLERRLVHAQQQQAQKARDEIELHCRGAIRRINQPDVSDAAVRIAVCLMRPDMGTPVDW